MPWIDPVDRFAKPPRLPPVAEPQNQWDGEIPVGDGDAAELEGVSIDGGAIDSTTYPSLELVDCSLTGVTFQGGGNSHVDLIDCVLTDCDLSRLRLGSTRGSRLVGCKLAGTDFSASTVRNVRFERCTLRYTNFRMSTLQRVIFVDCQLDETDLFEAQLEDVDFDACQLNEVNVDRVEFTRVDLRGVTSLGLTGITNLRGCLIGDSQVLQLAYTFALMADASIERPETD